MVHMRMCAALLALTATGISAQSAAELASKQTERYEIHAAAADLDRLERGVTRALDEYERIFGALPVPLVFVLHETDEQLAAYPATRFPGRIYQSWPARTTERGTVHVYPWNEIGAAFTQEASGPVRVALLYEPGVPRTALRAGDEIVAVGARAVAGMADFVGALRAAAGGSEVRLRVLRDGAEHEIAFMNPARQEGVKTPAHVLESLRKEPAPEPVSATTIAHEAMHALVNARYGHLPAWYSEGLAVLSEFPETHERQWWPLLRHFGRDLLPLRELLRMPHPASGGRVVGSSGGGNRTVQATASAGMATFYPHGMALLMFMQEVEGAAFLAQIADVLARGEDLEVALRGAGRLPHDVAQLQDEFRAWLRRRNVPVPGLEGEG